MLRLFDNVCLTGHKLLVPLKLGVSNYVYIISVPIRCIQHKRGDNVSNTKPST